jgi:hypothetical protein
VACCSEWEGHKTEGETEVEIEAVVRGNNFVWCFYDAIGLIVGPRSRG